MPSRRARSEAGRVRSETGGCGQVGLQGVDAYGRGLARGGERRRHRDHDLEVALELRLGAATGARSRARRRRAGSAARRSAAARRCRRLRSSTADTARPPSDCGGSARSRSIAASMRDRSSTRTDSWSVACTPVAAGRGRRARRAGCGPRALSRGGQLGDQQRRARRRPCRARRRGRRSSRAPPRSRTRGPGTRRDPLEAGERLGVRRPRRRRRSCRSSDEETIELAKVPRGAARAAGASPSSTPTSSPRSIRQSAVAGRDARPRTGRRPGRWR